MDNRGILKSIHDNVGILGLAELLRKQGATDVYVESSSVNHEKSLPKGLLYDSDRAVDRVMDKNVNKTMDLDVS